VAPRVKAEITDGDHHHHATGLGDPARAGVPRRSVSRLSFRRPIATRDLQTS
jgi:hypothetical protein